VIVSACAGTALEPASPTSTTSSSPSITTSTSTTTPPTTSTIAPTTTTTEAQPRCRPNPFTEEFSAALSSDYPGVEITAHVHDLRSNCGYSLNRDVRRITASVFKVMVMAGTLLEAQNDGRKPTEFEMNQMIPMITESANSPVRSLWRSFGASPWFREQAEIFGLRETRATGDGGQAWGGTKTSALDQVNLIRQVLLGDWGPLNAEYRQMALELMTSVVPDQTWGITAGVPDSWTVAQKNGFAGRTTNSVGWVDEPGDSRGYVIAILTRGWSSWQQGIPAVERISEQVAETMIETEG